MKIFQFVTLLALLMAEILADTLTAPGNCAGGGACIFNCADGACDSGTLNCESGQTCEINCDSNACNGPVINCNGATTCVINCNGDNSCNSESNPPTPEINCNTATSCTLNCNTAAGACFDLDFDCGTSACTLL
eukprot:308549_1